MGIYYHNIDISIYIHLYQIESNRIKSFFEVSSKILYRWVWESLSNRIMTYHLINTPIKHVFITRKFFKKSSKNGLLSCHSFNTCVIRTGCSTHHRFCLINVLYRLFVAERSPDVPVCWAHGLLFVVGAMCSPVYFLSPPILLLNHCFSCSTCCLPRYPRLSPYLACWCL